MPARAGSPQPIAPSCTATLAVRAGAPSNLRLARTHAAAAAAPAKVKVEMEVKVGAVNCARLVSCPLYTCPADSQPTSGDSHPTLAPVRR